MPVEGSTLSHSFIELWLHNFEEFQMCTPLRIACAFHRIVFPQFLVQRLTDEMDFTRGKCTVYTYSCEGVVLPPTSHSLHSFVSPAYRLFLPLDKIDRHVVFLYKKRPKSSSIYISNRAKRDTLFSYRFIAANFFDLFEMNAKLVNRKSNKKSDEHQQTTRTKASFARRREAESIFIHSFAFDIILSLSRTTGNFVPSGSTYILLHANFQIKIVIYHWKNIISEKKQKESDFA